MLLTLILIISIVRGAKKREKKTKGTMLDYKAEEKSKVTTLQLLNTKPKSQEEIVLKTLKLEAKAFELTPKTKTLENQQKLSAQDELLHS